MTITLHKLLALAASPLVLVMLLLVWGALRRSRATVLLAVLLLYLASMPLVARPFFRWVEQHQVRLPPQAMPRADAIVVLSGMLRDVPGPSGSVPEWGDAADRLFGGAELYRAGKAPRLVLTRGLLPWQTDAAPEGETLQPIAVQLGVPPAAIALTAPAQNTAQEAAAVRTLLDKPGTRILLVTSAFHMPRAQALFEQAGLAVTPYPVDFQVAVRATTPMDFLPAADALELTDTGVRELLGRAYYAVRQAL